MNLLGGYRSLPVFQQTEIIYDFTVKFCKKYIDYKSRTNDQMVQAARSGKQNIAEGYLQRSAEGKLKLLAVARGSLEELLCDYQDYLRQHQLPIWSPKDSKSMAIRRIAYNPYKSYNDYKNYIEIPESAANSMVCLINQTNLLLDSTLRKARAEFVQHGGFRENLLKDRLSYKNRI